MIKIGNIRTHKPDGSVQIYADRRSILGNPFYMVNESMRDKVCDKYEDYFNSNLVDPKQAIFRDELNRLVDLSRTMDITLLCWCHPKRCHTETIKRYLDALL
jgi:hypothetical protein